MGVGGQRHAPPALTSRERPGAYCIGGCVGPRDGGVENLIPQRGSISEPSSSQRVAIPAHFS